MKYCKFEKCKLQVCKFNIESKRWLYFEKRIFFTTTYLSLTLEITRPCFKCIMKSNLLPTRLPNRFMRRPLIIKFRNEITSFVDLYCNEKICHLFFDFSEVYVRLLIATTQYTTCTIKIFFNYFYDFHKTVDLLLLLFKVLTRKVQISQCFYRIGRNKQLISETTTVARISVCFNTVFKEWDYRQQ